LAVALKPQRQRQPRHHHSKAQRDHRDRLVKRVSPAKQDRRVIKDKPDRQGKRVKMARPDNRATKAGQDEKAGLVIPVRQAKPHLVPQDSIATLIVMDQ
jgi:hypothetical protein